MQINRHYRLDRERCLEALIRFLLKPLPEPNPECGASHPSQPNEGLPAKEPNSSSSAPPSTGKRRCRSGGRYRGEAA